MLSLISGFSMCPLTYIRVLNEKKKKPPGAPDKGKVTVTIGLEVSPFMKKKLTLIYKEFMGNKKNASSILRWPYIKTIIF